MFQVEDKFNIKAIGIFNLYVVGKADKKEKTITLKVSNSKKWEKIFFIGGLEYEYTDYHISVQVKSIKDTERFINCLKTFFKNVEFEYDNKEYQNIFEYDEDK